MEIEKAGQLILFSTFLSQIVMKKKKNTESVRYGLARAKKRWEHVSKRLLMSTNQILMLSKFLQQTSAFTV